MALMETETWVIGEVATFRVAFSRNSVSEDPGGATLHLRLPDDSTFSYVGEPIDDDVYHYEKAIQLDQSGEWNWRWEGSGNYTAIVQGTQWVEASNV